MNWRCTDCEKCAPWVYASVMSLNSVILSLRNSSSAWISGSYIDDTCCAASVVKCSVSAVQTMQHDNLVQPNTIVFASLLQHMLQFRRFDHWQRMQTSDDTRSSCSHSRNKLKCRQQGLCRSRRYKAGVMMPCMGDMHTVTAVSRRILGRFTVCLALSAQHDHSC